MRRGEAPSPAARTDWRAVWVVVAAGVVSAFHLGKVAIAAPYLQAEQLGLGLGMLGGLGATFAVLGALGGVVAGSVVARAGDHRMLLLGLLATALGAAMALPTGSFGVLLASRMVEGLGFLLITVAGPTVLARVVRADDQDTALVLWSCFMPTGMALAMLAGPWFGGWRGLWVGAALAAGLLAALVAWVVPHGPARSSVAPAARVAEVWRVALLAMAATFLLYSLMFFALFSFLPVLLQQRLQAGPGAVGLLAALACAANIAGNLAAGVLLKKASREALGTSAAAVMGLCGLGIFLPVLGPGPAFALCLVFSAVGGLVPACLMSSVPRVTATPAQAALAVGLLMQGSNLGQALGPVLVGSAVDRHGWPAAAAWVFAAALAMAWTVRWRARARVPQAQL